METVFNQILFTRDAFREGVFKRDNYKCVICSEPAQDAHHIIERKLFSDGGYYLDNGASLCGSCHIKAEMTTLTCEEIREKAGITRVVLPEHLYPDQRYDKWGNPIMSNGQRLRGDLFNDHSVQKILKEGKVLDEFAAWVKYPRTPHFEWSGTIGKDDRVIKNLDNFIDQEIIVTEKMDGENCTIYRDYIHARSVNGNSFSWQSWVKSLQAKIGWELPEGWRLCGENLFSKHAIGYNNLPGYFLLFAIYDENNVCLSWSDTEAYAEILGLPLVPVLYRGIWRTDVVKSLYPGMSIYGNEMEGYVVRVADSFHYSQFRNKVAKFVRPGHVPEHGGHWRHNRMEVNELA